MPESFWPFSGSRMEWTLPSAVKLPERWSIRIWPAEAEPVSSQTRAPVSSDITFSCESSVALAACARRPPCSYVNSPDCSIEAIWLEFGWKCATISRLAVTDVEPRDGGAFPAELQPDSLYGTIRRVHV